MTCREMDDVISSRCGDSVQEPQPAEHLMHCEHCRILIRLLDIADDGIHPSESLLKRIQTGILEDLRPIRPLAPAAILLFGCAIIFLAMIAIGVLMRGLNGWDALSLVQRIVVFVTLATCAVLLAVSMVRQMAPGSKNIFPPAVLLVTILSVFVMAIAATFRSQQEPAFLASGVMCMKNGLIYSMTTGPLLWLIVRRGAILYSKVIGALAGGLAGLAGLSVLEANCPNLNVFHILLWHGGDVIISSLGAALLGAAVESIERRRK